MILDKEITIKVSNRFLEKYKKMGFKDIKQGDFINIPIEHLPLMSDALVNVLCFFCEKSFKKKYGEYNKIVEKKDKYYCKKCTPIEYKKTCLEKYGVDNISKLDITTKKIKEKNLEKYGVDSYAKTLEFKKRYKETCLEKYGVENASQNLQIFSKQQKSRYEIFQYNNSDIFYQGSYEKDFLDKYYEKLNISKIDFINYRFDNKNKKYYPDFYISKYNLIIEIKSLYTYNKYLDKNISKKQACIELGYNFIFIINKDYSILKEIL